MRTMTEDIQISKQILQTSSLVEADNLKALDELHEFLEKIPEVAYRLRWVDFVNIADKIKKVNFMQLANAVKDSIGNNNKITVSEVYDKVTSILDGEG